MYITLPRNEVDYIWPKAQEQYRCLNAGTMHFKQIIDTVTLQLLAYFTLNYNLNNDTLDIYDSAQTIVRDTFFKQYI